MALREQIGIKFTLKDWKSLFSKDTYFLWNNEPNKDAIIIARFTIWNVLKFFILRLCVKVVLTISVPFIRLAYKYWFPVVEGSEFKEITLMMRNSSTFDIKFFRMGNV